MHSKQEHAVSEIEQKIVERLEERRIWLEAELKKRAEYSHPSESHTLARFDGAVTELRHVIELIRSLPAPPPEPAPPVEVHLETWHYCGPERKIRKYPVLLCSCCRELDASRDFDVPTELAALREQLRVAESKPCPVCEQRAQFAKSITSGEFREQHTKG